MSDAGIWSDLAQWVGPTVNETPGGMVADPWGLILHIEQGTNTGSIAWCKNPASKVSAHFFAPKTGTMKQLVSVLDKAWAEVDGNPEWISLECEGKSGDSLTPDQILSAAQLLARIHLVYGAPLSVSDDPYHVKGLTGHGLGGAGYGGHYDCPGAPILAQRTEIIHQAAIIVAEQTEGPVSLTAGDITAIKLAVWGYENPKLDQHDMRQTIVNAETNSAHAVTIAGGVSAQVTAVAADLAAIKSKLGI